MFRLTYLISTCALAGGALFAASDSASVSGVVSDASGALVSGARIVLHRASGLTELSTTADGAGRFLFENAGPGSYLVEASAPGLTLSDALKLELTAGERRELKLQLSLSALTTLVSVTSSGAAQPADQVAKALDIVDTDEAARRGLFSVADALRFVPGLRVSTRGSPGAFTTIQTRGLRVTDTAVLVDGFPFRDSASIQDEASAYLGDMLLVDSSRIEVLRGSGSSLYGSNAMSGTVNIITAGGGETPHGDLDLQGGGLGLFHGVARLTGGSWKNRLHYSLGAAHLNETRGVAESGAVRDWNGQGAVEILLRPNMRILESIFGNGGYLQLNASPSPAPGAPTAGIIAAAAGSTFTPSLADPDYGRYSHFVNSLLRFEHDVAPQLSYRVAYGIADSERSNTNGPAGPQTLYVYQPAFNALDRYSGRLDTLQARVNYTPNTHQVLSGGYEFQRENYAQLAQDPFGRTGTTARQQTHAVFAQDEIRLLEGRLQILLSARFTQASLSQPAFQGARVSPYAAVPLPSPPHAYTGDAAVSYFFKSTATKLRAHAGNSFRLPSIYERFGGYFFGGTFYAIGDPNLAPERAVSGDAGFDQYLLHDHVKVSGSYFYSRLQQVIGYLDFPPGYTDVYGRSGGYRPRAGGMARGAEWSADLHPTRRTSVRASYVYTNARDRASQYYTGSTVNPLQTPRISPHMFTAVATQQLTKRIDVAMDFAGGSDYLFPLYGFDSSFNYQPFAYRFPGQRLLGVAAGYSLPLGERVTARLYTRVSNALGQGYFEDGFATPGRWAVAGLRFGF